MDPDAIEVGQRWADQDDPEWFADIMQVYQLRAGYILENWAEVRYPDGTHNEILQDALLTFYKLEGKL